MGDICFGMGEKIVFIGDSITDCGRRTEQDGPYGKGYVSLVRALLHARYPAHGLTIVNRGIGGNTIRDLAARWQEDVLNEAPDWLSVKIGINDVGQGDPAAKSGISLAEVQQQFSAMRASGAREGALLTAGWMYFRAYIDSYIEVVHRLAAEYDAILVRTQAAFDVAMEAQPPAAWAADRIHPDLPGHAVIARAFLAAVGYGDI